LNWKIIARYVPNRTPRQCKERWSNYLQPAITSAQWTQLEDRVLHEKYNELGSKWMRIAKFFVNRTDAQVKNRFLVLKRRGMRAAGIPPPPRASKKKLIAAAAVAVDAVCNERGECDSGLLDGSWGSCTEIDDLGSLDDFMWNF
jgi:hypothetical protein